MYYRKERKSDKETIVTDNLLEIIEPTLPRYSLRKKLKGYLEFLDSNEWQEGTGKIDGSDEGDALPIILIVCPTKATLIYTKRVIKSELAEYYGEDEGAVPEDIHFRLTTTESIKRAGLTGGIWEEV